VNCCTDPALDLVRDFLFVSSCSVYGNTHGLYLEVTEDTPPHPLSAYAYAKLRAEQIILTRGKEVSHFHPTVLRLTTVFGWSRRPRLDLVTNRFAYSAYKDHRITIYGTGKQYRSLVHVQDVATAIADVLEAPRFARDGQIFHVGTKTNNKTLNGIAEIIQGIMPGTDVVYKEKQTDRRDYAVNCLKIKNLIGWEPKWPIEDGVKDLIEKLEHLGWDWESGKYRNNSYDYT
jgi:nucleoside-diphosphate-sugar epimerase